MIVCAAPGPSLRVEDLNRARAAGAQVLCVTRAYLAALWADWLYACDPRWWDYYGPDVRARFRGERWTQRQTCGPNRLTYQPDELAACERWDLRWMPSHHGAGLGESRIQLSDGGSGYHAINLAYLFGARRILLLGYDGQGAGHWDGNDYPVEVGRSAGGSSVYHVGYARLVADLHRAGVEILNCSRETAHTAIPRATIEEALG